MVYPHSILTARAIACKAVLISGSVFSNPSEKRILCREAADSGFIALTTGDGLSEFARHAEPEDAWTPA